MIGAQVSYASPHLRIWIHDEHKFTQPLVQIIRDTRDERLKLRDCNSPNACARLTSNSTSSCMNWHSPVMCFWYTNPVCGDTNCNNITFHSGLHAQQSQNRQVILYIVLRLSNNLRKELWVLPRGPDGDGGVVAARAEHALGPLLRVRVRDVAYRHVGLGLL